jgi:hypothetical protein
VTPQPKYKIGDRVIANYGGGPRDEVTFTVHRVWFERTTGTYQYHYWGAGDDRSEHSACEDQIRQLLPPAFSLGPSRSVAPARYFIWKCPHCAAVFRTSADIYPPDCLCGALVLDDRDMTSVVPMQLVKKTETT